VLDAEKAAQKSREGQIDQDLKISAKERVRYDGARSFFRATHMIISHRSGILLQIPDPVVT
jgi:hypothetical protein